MRQPAARKRPRVLKQRLGQSDLDKYVRPGLRALGNDVSVIRKGARPAATDSLSFDEVQKNAPTFDYLAGIAADMQFVVAIEVHPAQTRAVNDIIEKKRRTLAFMTARGCACRIDHWIWASTGGVSIRPDLPSRFNLAEEGIEWPQRQIDWPSATRAPEAR